MWGLTMKMKRLKQAIIQWNKNNFGDIYGNIKVAEQAMEIKELVFRDDSSPEKKQDLLEAQ
ncbi:hypothetical protein ACH5RR_003317, partial [Cinchona calisaya]